MAVAPIAYCGDPGFTKQAPLDQPQTHARVTDNCTLRDYFASAASGRRLTDDDFIHEVLITRLNLRMATLNPETDLVSCAIHDCNAPFCPEDAIVQARKLARRLGRQLACLDVGANLGSCGLWWLSEQLCHTVVFYEPNPLVARLLNWTLTHNALRGRGILRVAAASDVASTRQLALARGNSGHSMLGELAGGWSQLERHVEVPAVRLDEEPDVAALGAVDVIKLDVEGLECEALRGLGFNSTHRRGGLPAEQVAVLVVEADDTLLRAAGCSEQQLRAFFPPERFHVYGAAGVSSDLLIFNDRAMSRLSRAHVKHVGEVRDPLQHQAWRYHGQDASGAGHHSNRR